MQDSVQVVIAERLPGVADYNRLRRDAGWGTYDDLGAVRRGLDRSLYGVCALVAGRVVGMARVIGDGALCFYIQDVIVQKEYQRQGIGLLLMERVMAYLGRAAMKHSVVGLIAAQGKEGFYQRWGFVARPNERLGCGMTLSWDR